MITRFLLRVIGILYFLLSCYGFPCENEGTYDDVYDRCECTPDYYGYRCETAFSSTDLCNDHKLPVIADPYGLRRPGADGKITTEMTNRTNHIKSSFLDSSELAAGWYRVQSPWGNRLVEGCSSRVKDSDCGGRAAYVLHDVVEENGSKMPLFKARAFRVWRELNDCRLVHETFFPVRLLKCSESLTLYFLLPLPSMHSYCIGDEKDPSDERLAEMIFYKKPILQLKHHSGGGDFLCSVFGSRSAISVYVMFLLTTTAGETKAIQACDKIRQPISKDFHGNCIFLCAWSDIVYQEKNIYGSTLECRVQTNARNNAPFISSNIHSFVFRHSFTHGFDSIRPGKPVELCISSGNIPTREKITFSLSVARKIVYRNDRINIATLSNDANSTNACDFEFSSQKVRQVCVKLVLYNDDHEGKVVFGLESTEQVSYAKINMYYRSTADGLRTYRNSVSNVPKNYQQFASYDLKVDLRSLVSGPQSYLHIFSDPFVKPVNATYANNSTYELKAKRGETDIYVAMRHKQLPYETHILITRPQSAVLDNIDLTVVTQVAVRYDQIIITISASANKNNGALTPQIDCKASHSENLQNNGEIWRNSKCDLRRNGIEVESTSDVVRIYFQFYGTIIYVWKFRSSMATSSSCAHGFIMSQQEMRNIACRSGEGTNLVGDDFVLDLTIIPSLYDSPGNVEGLMYTKNALEAESYRVKNASENLFSDKYVARSSQNIRSSLISQPYEIMRICKCLGIDQFSKKARRCFVDLSKATRTKRDVRVRNARQFKSSHKIVKRENTADPAVRKQITAEEAKQFCDEFLYVQMTQRNYSISLCSGHSDHPFAADYTAQFGYLCVRYAQTLGIFQFAESLLNSMLDKCLKDLDYNATEVRSKSHVLIDLEQDLCPNNCSSNGLCLAGACVCNSGYVGRGCENRTKELEASLTWISTSNQTFVCPSETCSSALLLVSPLLKSTEANCIVEEVVDANKTARRRSWIIPASFATGRVMACNLSIVHSWLKDRNRLFVVVMIKLAAVSWNSSNSASRLLVQSRCSGLPTHCYPTDRTKQIVNEVSEWSCAIQGSNGATGSVECSQNVDKKQTLVVSLVTVLVTVLFVSIAVFVLALKRRSIAAKIIAKEATHILFKTRCTYPIVKIQGGDSRHLQTRQDKRGAEPLI